MAAARGFRPTKRGYLGRFYIAADEADGIETPPDTTISPDGGFFVHANPYQPCSHVAMQSPPATEDGEPYHLMLIEYDTDDVLDEGGGSRALWWKPGVDSPDDPKISKAWAKIATGTVVAELTLDEIATIAYRSAYNEVGDVVAILAAYSWGDWSPVLVP